MVNGARAGDVRRRDDRLQTAPYLIPKRACKKTTNIVSDVRVSQDTRILRTDYVGPGGLNKVSIPNWFVLVVLLL